jgi:tRNA (adenine37-N6)-methyltransferase
MQIEPIGIIRTPFATKEACPIQGHYSEDTKGTIEIFVQYGAGLQDIETFSHLILIYQFDRAGAIKLVRPTFLDDKPHGIFASRHPCRPSGLGLSVVRFLRRHENTLEVGGIDVLDQTPLIDIKPYVPRFDAFPDASEGWIAKKKWRPKPDSAE